jgi:MHS family proline/betaine transporter-like MFS transporter
LPFLRSCSRRGRFGSILLGHVGDHYGRKPGLVIAVLHTALATFAMGLSLTHAAIGVTAPMPLVAARLLQGLSAGGEVSGAASFVAKGASRCWEASA